MTTRLLLTLLVLATASRSWTQGADTIEIRSALIIKAPPGFPDNIARRDPLEAALVEGAWTAPVAGESIRYSDTASGTWEAVAAGPSGWYEHPALEAGYVYASVELDQAAPWILEAFGNSMVYVNGAARSGNPYGSKDRYEPWEPHFDYSLLPVMLNRGKNEFLFHCTRGILKARLVHPARQVFINARDATLPDFIAGVSADTWGAVVVVNASANVLRGLTLRARVENERPLKSPVPLIQPFSLRKIAFRLRAGAAQNAGTARVRLMLARGPDVLDTAGVTLRVVTPAEPRKETFLSSIDQSIQYYAIAPASSSRKPVALFLSLHGAGVEAINQAASYYVKSWGHIVAPTNRRPFGFNWEDWGRDDAMEVLNLIKRRYRIDENRIYLTGHSMGGHGVYHIGSLFPDEFAAIGPSAAWLSFWTYRVRETVENPSPMHQMLMRSTLPSETLTMAENFTRFGVYILHGSDDDNVPVEQSRIMAKHLASFHKDYVYHEQPGVSHWWDLSPAPGADCVDWGPMFDFFARHARPAPAMLREVTFVTPAPSVSSRCSWVRVDAQTEQLKLSRVSLRFEPGLNRVTGTTLNVARLALVPALMGAEGPLSIELDNQNLKECTQATGDSLVWLYRMGGIWRQGNVPSPELKGASRYGIFRDVFHHRVVFVYGTAGTEEENRWAFEKSRFDAERFWYQGNGSIEVTRDTDFRAEDYPQSNVVLYGNAATNRAWEALWGRSPVQIDRGEITLGETSYRGSDLACVAIRPRMGTPDLCVGAIGGSGITGMRLTDRMPYLLPGVAFPDVLIARTSLLSRGEDGVEAAGFFGLDWSLTSGEFVRR